MASQLHLEIVTHDGVAFEGVADGLIAPGRDGYFGMLPHHAPIIAELGIGDLRVRQGTEWQHFAITGGILHLRDGRATIMADAAERPDEIDASRARAAADRARDRLAHRRLPDVDMQRAEVALQRAINRLRLADLSPD